MKENSRYLHFVRECILIINRPHIYSFTCTEKEGCFLRLLDNPTYLGLNAKQQEEWRDYMRKSGRTWYTEAKRKNTSFGSQALVFITGHIKAPRYAAAAFKGKGDYQFLIWHGDRVRTSISGPEASQCTSVPGPGLGQWIQEQVRVSHPDLYPAQYGTSPPDAKQRQECIFVEYFEVTRLWPNLPTRRSPREEVSVY